MAPRPRSELPACPSSTRTTSPAGPPAAATRAPAGGVATTDSQTLMIRRAVALGVGVLVLILLVFVVNACQDSRHKNALKDYNRADLRDRRRVRRRRSARRSSSCSPGRQRVAAGPADEHLRLPRAGRAAVRPGRGARRAGRHEGRPAVAADRARVRRDGLDKIASGSAPRSATRATAADAAIEQIAGQMQAFLASDVAWTDARDPAHQGRARRDGDRRPADRQLRSSCRTSRWLQPADRRRRCSTSSSPSSGGSGERRSRPAPGLHGTGLDATVVRRHDAAARRHEPARPTRRTSAFTVKFTNQGENDEFDIKVTLRISERAAASRSRVQDGPEARAAGAARRSSSRSTSSRRSARP